MNTKKNIAKGLLGVSVVSLFAASSAFAGGTQAGTSVKNTFTLDYKVGTVTQPTIETCKTGDTGCTVETSTNFTVDRLVDLTVASSADTNVSPGEQDATLSYTVSNDSNDAMAYALSLVNETTDNFNAASMNITYYVDNGTGGVCDATDLGGSGTAYTAGGGSATVDIAADGVICVVVDSDIAGTVVDTNTAKVSLVADTLYPTTASGSLPGTEVLADPGGVNALVGDAENVLADGTGTASTGDANNAGDHSATGSYIVESPNLSASKAVTIFSQDGSGCATIPGTPASGEQYSVPGACVEYVISAVNAGAIAAANSIDISDILPDDLEFVSAAQTIFTGASLTVPGGVNPAVSPVDCDSGACTVGLTGGTLAASSTGTLVIRALVK